MDSRGRAQARLFLFKKGRKETARISDSGVFGLREANTGVTQIPNQGPIPALHPASFREARGPGQLQKEMVIFICPNHLEF